MSTTEKCPIIAGLYSEMGEAPFGCPEIIEACQSLSYNLLSGQVGYKEVWDESSEPRIPTGTHLELRQPAENSLEIIQWQWRDREASVLSQKTLKMEKGDFTCGPDGLTLEPRLVYTFFILVDLLGSLNTTFNRSEDGYLVMDSDLGIIGHNVYYIGARRFGTWVRWKPTTWDEVAMSAPTSTASSRYVEVAGLTYEQLLAKAELGNAEAQLQLYWSSGEQTRLNWLCRAADLGHPDAQNRFGLLHQHGKEGVRQDAMRAYMWYRLAASNGNYTATAEAQALLENMTAGQAMEAEVLLQKWKPGQCERELAPTSSDDQAYP